MRPTYIYIAGLPSSGKTAAITFIKKEFPRIKAYRETAQILIDKNKLMGGVNIKRKFQLEIAKANLKKFKKIAQNQNLDLIHLDETGPFTQIYSKLLLTPKDSEYYDRQQKIILDQLNTGCIFIDSSPEICFKRRKESYFQRAEKYLKENGKKGKESNQEAKELIDKSRQRIFILAPLLDEYFQKIQTPKIKVENNHSDLNQFKKEVLDAFEKMVEMLSPTFKV